MKKLIALAIVAAFALGVPALAAQTKPATEKDKGEHARGTITAWDDAAKTLKVKDKNGKEWDFSWNESTKITGTPKVGETVSLQYMKGADGKSMATHITVSEPKPAAKKP